MRYSGYLTNGGGICPSYRQLTAKVYSSTVSRALGRLKFETFDLGLELNEEFPTCRVCVPNLIDTSICPQAPIPRVPNP